MLNLWKLLIFLLILSFGYPCWVPANESSLINCAQTSPGFSLAANNTLIDWILHTYLDIRNKDYINLQIKREDLNEKSRVSSKDLRISIKTQGVKMTIRGSFMKILRSPMKIWRSLMKISGSPMRWSLGSPIVLQWWWFLSSLQTDKADFVIRGIKLNTF